jgi:hypothetical protein
VLGNPVVPFIMPPYLAKAFQSTAPPRNFVERPLPVTITQ